MKLSSVQKERLIANAKKVYLGYLALDFSKTKKVIHLTANGHRHEPMSIAELFQFMKTNTKSPLDISIAGKTYSATLMQGPSKKYSLKLSVPVAFRRPASPIQHLDDYSNEQIANLLTQTDWTMEDLPNGETAVSLPLKDGDKQFMIGGPGKFDLYRTHLVTLSNIIHKLESEQDLSALLVALATGTGKTFVQALWASILYLSDVTGIFGVPDELISQFIKDFRRLLPDSFVDQILSLRKKSERHADRQSEEAKTTLENLQTHPGQIIVADSRRLLDEFYPALLAAPSDKTFLTIDEQHLLMANERRRRRLLQLPGHLLSLFLTATPDEETYRISGSAPVATMSNRQKELAGQGRLPKFETLEVPFMSDLNRKHSGWWKWLKNIPLISIPSIVFPEISSAAQFAIERLPLIFQYDNAQDQAVYGARWNLHVPMARKVLTVIDDNETLVNFMHYLTDTERLSSHRIAGKAPQPASLQGFDSHRGIPTVYSRGAFEPNGMFEPLRACGNGLYQLSRSTGGLSDLPNETIPLWGTDELIAKERAAVWDAVSAQLPNQDTKNMMRELADEGMVAQLRSNMFHYLIEYVISDLTGLDTIQLNKMRKQNLPALIDLVKQRCQNVKSANGYATKLSKLIDNKGANQIGGLLEYLSGYLHTAISNKQSEKVRKFVDNWFLDSSIKDEMTNENTHVYFGFSEHFREYIRRYLMMAVMGGMDNEETPIADSQPFVTLKSTKLPVFDENGRFSKHAKPRQRHSIQILIGQGSEDIFSPEYINITEEQADNYFRLGFIGTYISNKKHKGFSDLNLHTVLNLAEQTVNPNNSPEITIQASGRNRGLDDTVIPTYVHVLGHKQMTHFDSKMLDKDNYYADFFRAQAQYNDKCIDLLGINLAKRIKELYFQYKGEEGVPIDAEALHSEITQEIAKYLRDINNRNSHNIALSRKLLTRVVAKAMSTLEQDINNLRSPYKLSSAMVFLLNSITSGAQFIFYLLNFSQNRQINQKLREHAASLNKASRGVYDDAYLKVNGQMTSMPNLSAILPELQNTSKSIGQNLIKELQKLRNKAIPKTVLPKKIQDAILEIERQAADYGYSRDILLTILNYSTRERETKLSWIEKSYLLPSLQEFENLLARHSISHPDLFHALDWQAPDSSGNTTISFDQMIKRMQDLYQTAQTNLELKVEFIISAKNLFFDVNIVQICQVLGHLNRNDLIALVQMQGYNDDPAAAADRILNFIAIVKAKDIQRFEKEFLNSTNSKLPVFSLLHECSLCLDSLTKSNIYFGSKRFDRAYLSIIRKINRTELLGAVTPGLELIAWVRKKALPLRNALYAKLIELNVPENDLQRILSGPNKAKQQEIPKGINIKLKNFAKRAGYGYERLLLDNLGRDKSILPKEIAEQISEIEILIGKHDLSIAEFKELFESQNDESANSSDSYQDLNRVVVLFMMLMQDPAHRSTAINLVIDHLLPIIFHPQFVEMFNLVIGNLDREDLAAVLETIDVPKEAEAATVDPVAGAERLLALNNILQTKNLEKLRTEFLTIPEGKNLEDLPLMKVFGECMAVGSAVLASQEHYTQATLKGERVHEASANPFIKKISANLREIQLPYRSAENGANMVKGLIKGFDKLARVGGDANKDDIRFLTRIKNHILRPIWWTTSLSKWAFYFVEKAKTVAFWLRDKGFIIWNKLCQFHAWMRGHSQIFQPSVKSEMSVAYNKATFEAVSELNGLRQFSSRDVEQADCADDTIVAFERKIEQRRTQRMFAPATVVEESKRQDAVLYESGHRTPGENNWTSTLNTTG
ncbi:MAG: DEAD/DEAH box helicase family protein [Gammaproteobacteria bacterium]